jgi:hypothetical protein
VRTWDVFFPDVLPEVLGCPEPTVERALLHAAREFCVKSRCWRADLDRITTRADRADYDLSYPVGADAVEFIGATFNGHEIDLDVMDGTSTEDRRRGTAGSRRLLTWDQRTVTLIPTPADAGGLIVITAILQPSDSATGLPDDIADRHKLAIATGALARLLAMPRAEWHNTTAAASKAEAFKDAIGDAKKRAWKAHTTRRPRAQAMFY